MFKKLKSYKLSQLLNWMSYKKIIKEQKKIENLSYGIYLTTPPFSLISEMCESMRVKSKNMHHLASQNLSNIITKKQLITSTA